MQIKKYMTLGEASEGISFRNPGGRSIRIEENISGAPTSQVFHSGTLPKELRGQFIGVEMDSKGDLHPKFALTEVTSQKLGLYGKLGYIHAVSIMDAIASALVLQSGIFEARSMRVTDNVVYPYSALVSNDDYWLASRVVSEQPYHPDVNLYGLNYVTNRRLSNSYLFSSECDDNRGAGKHRIRPVVILQSIINIEDKDPSLQWFSGEDE